MKLEKGKRYLLKDTPPYYDIHEVKILEVSEKAYKIEYLSGFTVWKEKTKMHKEYDVFEEL